MNFVFTSDGFRRLAITWFILGASIVAAVAIGWGSHVYLQGEKRDGVSSRRQLAEAQARVDAAKREREDLKASAEIFEDLVKRGILQEENRLDFIERLGRLKARHQLFALDYEIAPQRALPLAGGRAFNTVDVLGSRITLRAQALHEGDALAFLQELATPPRGFTTLSRCVLRKVEAGSADAAVPRAEAQCTLEWITLKDKRVARAN